MRVKRLRRSTPRLVSKCELLGWHIHDPSVSDRTGRAANLFHRYLGMPVAQLQEGVSCCKKPSCAHRLLSGQDMCPKPAVDVRLGEAL